MDVVCIGQRNTFKEGGLDRARYLLQYFDNFNHNYPKAKYKCEYQWCLEFINRLSAGKITPQVWMDTDWWVVCDDDDDGEVVIELTVYDGTSEPTYKRIDAPFQLTKSSLLWK